MFDLIGLIFVFAAVLGYVNSRVFRLPAAIGVMTAALLASLLVIALESVLPQFHLMEDLRGLMGQVDFADALMRGMLSFLLFAGALHVDLGALRQWMAPIGLLATIGVLVSTAIVGVGAWLLFDLLDVGVPLSFCLVFGALISPTDPVAVLGIMRQAGAPADIEIKVIGESLFNDGVGVVLFSVLLSIALAASGAGDAGHGALGVADVLWILVKEVGGGVALGLGGGLLTYAALKTLEEPNLETLISFALVMALTGIAFRLHASAPLAAVVAGLFIGNRGRTYAMGEATRERLDAVWSFVDEALNVVLFLLMGLEIVVLDFGGGAIVAGALCFLLVLAARAAGVWVPVMLLGRRRVFRKGARRILIWGGIRGGISIALALSLPEFEGRAVVIAATYVVVVVSVLGQGLTIGRLIERLVPAEEREQGATHH